MKRNGGSEFEGQIATYLEDISADDFLSAGRYIGGKETEGHFRLVNEAYCM